MKHRAQEEKPVELETEEDLLTFTKSTSVASKHDPVSEFTSAGSLILMSNF